MSQTIKQTEPVEGAPFRPGQPVRVSSISDETAHRTFLGKSGRVAYLDYDCGCGQSYPYDPMIGVIFADGTAEEFWREELASRSPRKEPRQ